MRRQATALQGAFGAALKLISEVNGKSKRMLAEYISGEGIFVSPVPGLYSLPKIAGGSLRSPPAIFRPPSVSQNQKNLRHKPRRQRLA